MTINLGEICSNYHLLSHTIVLTGKPIVQPVSSSEWCKVIYFMFTSTKIEIAIIEKKTVVKNIQMEVKAFTESFLEISIR